MASPDDLERRVSAVERDVAEMRALHEVAAADATAARVLAAGADRDVSEVRAELRAHTQALNALRQTQVEQGRAIDELGRGVDVLGDAVERGFADVNAGLSEIVRRLPDS